MTTDAGMRPIIMTVLYAPDNKADLWEGANGADEESAGGGRDMLISAAPIDALKIGMAARENTLSVRTLSFLMASRSSGSTLAKLRSRKGISLSDINPQHNKDEKLAGELIRGLLKPEEPEMTPPPKPRQETVRWHWEYRTEEINREIEIYRGKELTKVQVPAGTRRIRVKVWDNVATAVSPPRVEPLPPVIGARG
jgi:hypothetical protein